jgi:hypothetical protein
MRPHIHGEGLTPLSCGAVDQQPPSETPPPDDSPPLAATPPADHRQLLGETPPTANHERRAGRPLLAIGLAVLIGFTSVLSAVVAWRASLASIDSSRHQSLAVQEQARSEQISRQLEAIVAQDQRLLVSFQEHALAARELRAQADEVVGSEPEMADSLDLQAQGRLAQARALQPFFQGAYGVYLDDEGTVAYDPVFVLRNLLERNVELRELRPDVTLAQAQQADTRTVSLIGVAAILVAALFFLTVAQTVRRRLLLRHGFALVGAVLVVAGAVGLVVVEMAA